MNRVETQTRILAAALEAFAERGFASTTTAEIARRAGVAEKTVFSHFKSKEALFEQTLQPATLELLIPEARAGLVPLLTRDWGTLEEFLTAFVTNRIEVFSLHPAKLKLIVQEILLRPERAGPFRHEYDCKFAPLFTRTFERLRQKGLLADVHQDVLQRALASAIFGYAMQRFILRPDLDWDDDAEIAAMVHVLVNGLRNPSKGTEPSKSRRPKKAPKASRAQRR